jgi:hypothetical protein
MATQPFQKLRDKRHFNSLIENLENLMWSTPAEISLESLVDHLLIIFNEADRLISNDPHNMSWIAKRCSSLYRGVRRIWNDCAGKEAFTDKLTQMHLQSVLCSLINLVGISMEKEEILLVGIAPELNRLIVDCVIEYKLPSENISTQGKHEEYQAAEVLNDGYLWLLRMLVDAGSVDEALDLLEAIKLTYAGSSNPWDGKALSGLVVELFDKEFKLDERQKQRFAQYMSHFSQDEKHSSSISHRMDSMVNMAKSGLEEIAGPLIHACLKKADSFGGLSPYTLLTDIERHANVDVTEILDRWAYRYNNDLDDEALRVVIGYQLLGASDEFQENLLAFFDDSHYQVFGEILSGTFKGGDSDVYSVNRDRLKVLIAEFMAQRPGSIKALGRDPVLGEIASKLPAWYVDKLEDDLGL